ncbi:MAG: hypothetical protein KF881_08910 [Acidobacteria bacterium]|nr:hypothetical protein [Acidobacteriota bacterium]
MREIGISRKMLFALMAAGTLAVGAQTLPAEKEQKDKIPAAEPKVEKPAVPITVPKDARPILIRPDVTETEVVDDPKRRYEENNFLGNESYERAPITLKPNFNWKGATLQSLMFLGVQHGFRLLEPKTREELKGPFFKDWKDSVKNLEGWDDGGKFFTNYIAHPLEGSAMARIYLNNDRQAGRVEFGKDARYWKTRAKAFLWATAWNVQFEIGPISEASIGNVGRVRHSNGKSKMTWGDIVVTPTGGIALAIAEDAIDKYVLQQWIERDERRSITFAKKMLRTVLTPTMSFTNLLRGHAPWWREHRRN